MDRKVPDFAAAQSGLRSLATLTGRRLDRVKTAFATTLAPRSIAG